MTISLYNFPLQINISNEISGDLKTMIFGQLGVPVCQQLLTGWKSEISSDNNTLASLRLPRENLLFLASPDSDNNGMDIEGYLIIIPVSEI